MAQDPAYRPPASPGGEDGSEGLSGWADLTTRPAPAPAGSASGLDSPNRYCSYCWADLPSSATECPDCGKSVAEMQAQAAARAEADAKWTPPVRRIPAVDESAPPPPSWSARRTAGGYAPDAEPEPELEPTPAAGYPAAEATPAPAEPPARARKEKPPKPAKEPKPARAPKVKPERAPKPARPARAPRRAPSIAGASKGLLIGIGVVVLLVLAGFAGVALALAMTPH